MGKPITMRGVSKSYKDAIAVNEVSLTVSAGEFLTLLGASGSGKTTLLRMIAGFVDPDGGDIEIGGKDVTHMPSHKRDIGMVFQNYALFPHLNVFRNIAFPLEMRNVPRAQRSSMVTEALSLVKLAGFEGRLPKEMSGGQQQRVAFARATVFHPSILLMDEPLGALDRNLREELQLEILRLSRELELTVVYVTHDQSEAFSMSDRIALLGRGSIVQCCSPSEMYAAPESAAVAKFVGEANVFRMSPSDGATGILDPQGPVDLSRSQWVVPRNTADNMAVVVRPQAMRVRSADVADGLEGPGGGQMTGLVRSIIFAGHEYRVIVDVGQPEALLVRTDSESLTGVQVGGRVNVSWRSENAVVTRMA